MKVTRIYKETLAAFINGCINIINRGGTRSSKTFSALQVIYTIMVKSKKALIISVVSHSLPHLEGGAIRDFDKILAGEGIDLDSVKTKRPYIYKIGKCTLEFIGFDKPGKTLGAARDILFINEANLLPWKIVHHLTTRTTKTVFIDFNPSEEFWVDTEGISKQEGSITINSTFRDNIQNLSSKQIQELKTARDKARAEEDRGVKGYWSNWWKVYGLGLKGMLEGVIFNNWQEYSELPEDIDLFKMYVVDWGGNDPTTLSEIHINKKERKIFIREILYTPQILNNKLIELIQEINPENHVIICDSARKDKIYELQMAGLNAIKCSKGSGSVIDGIDIMQEYELFVHKDSENGKAEFSKYKWLIDKKIGKALNDPEDDNNHIIDAVRYGVKYYHKNYL